MLLDVFKKLDVYRKEINEFISYDLIESKEKELGIIFPESIKEFYHYYGNDKIVKTADYVFDDINDIRIEDNALCFGYYNQGGSRLGIMIENIKRSKCPQVSYRSKDDFRWYCEEGVDVIFFFRSVCWQIMISMQGVARTEMDKKQFETLIGNDFEYLNGQKAFLLSPVIPIVSDKILGCYLVRDELLYLGTNEEDDVLNEFEEKYDLDLDWL